ncbi:hypothetical protein LTR86_001996 [Recurvomyces mirabilis]|nr:hypothetical protein LTR86_001996 [Recurvomyces mirabilis]
MGSIAYYAPKDGSKRAVTILVTGFGPFQEKYPVNPSWEIARSLPSVLPKATADGRPIQIITYGSPIRVCYKDSYELIPPLLEAYSSTIDLVLHIGMASGRAFYTAERYAHRDGYVKNKDLDGLVPPLDESEDLSKDCPERLETSLDFERLLQQWQYTIKHLPATSPAHGADCRASDDAGHYLCDYTYRNSMVWYGRTNEMLEGGKKSDRPVMFLHVPAESDEAMLKKGAVVAIALLEAMVDDLIAPDSS